jgi:hypothetical protein
VCVYGSRKPPPTSNANTPALTRKRTTCLPALHQWTTAEATAFSEQGEKQSKLLSLRTSLPLLFPPTPNTQHPAPIVASTRPPHTHTRSCCTTNPFPPASTSSGPSCYFHWTSQLVLPHLPLQTFPATCSFTPRLAPPPPIPSFSRPLTLCPVSAAVSCWSLEPELNLADGVIWWLLQIQRAVPLCFPSGDARKPITRFCTSFLVIGLSHSISPPNELQSSTNVYPCVLAGFSTRQL